jgi:hypothetical protein
MQEMHVISVARVSIDRTSQYFLRGSRFDVLIDGQTAASIASGETIDIDMQPGSHIFAIKCGAHFSEDVILYIDEGASYHLECGSNIKGWRFLVFFQMLFRPWEWLYLKQV